ncbi:uncharacterized protein LOC120010553 [Tripterygium wilfordii]|uniref:uncharacterized protein LOC120010553 n=1 Tax=Tripterygium wilfordii TaxID=458696 RepID=UPI0018F80572|nr:uncharacterized protein LOC120010553 [Tripterygium wilfordii]
MGEPGKLSPSQEFYNLASESICSLQQMIPVESERILSHEIRQSSTWCPPQSGLIKINFDAAVRLNQNTTSLGCIIRDDQGFPMTACSDIRLVALNPLMAEASSALLALQFAKGLGLHDVHLEGDSLTIINAINA